MNINYQYEEFIKNKLLSINPTYFISLSFIPKHPSLGRVFTSIDVDGSFFMRVLHQQLFGNNFHRNNRLINFALIRELHKSGKDHCHILIGNNEPVSFSNMKRAFVRTSWKMASIKSVLPNEREILTFSYYKNDLANYTKKNKDSLLYDDGYPLNLQKVEHGTEDILRQYVMNQAWKNEFPIHISIKGITNKKDFFKINTNKHQ